MAKTAKGRRIFCPLYYFFILAIFFYLATGDFSLRDHHFYFRFEMSAWRMFFRTGNKTETLPNISETHHANKQKKTKCLFSPISRRLSGIPS